MTMRLIDADALAKNGWVLERHGVSNTLLERMSIADVPTIEAEPVKHGRWEFKHPNGWACSECGEWGLMIDNRGICKSDYCPNCGAKMDQKEECL